MPVDVSFKIEQNPGENEQNSKVTDKRKQTVKRYIIDTVNSCVNQCINYPFTSEVKQKMTPSSFFWDGKFTAVEMLTPIGLDQRIYG